MYIITEKPKQFGFSAYIEEKNRSSIDNNNNSDDDDDDERVCENAEQWKQCFFFTLILSYISASFLLSLVKYRLTSFYIHYD